MKLENYEVHLPNYSIGNQIYDRIGPVCESYGRTVLVIGGEKALAAAYDKIERAVQKTNLQIIGKVLYGEDCTYAAVDRLRQMPLYRQADMVFGVGGGKALDTVKCLCIPDDKPVFAFPTIASNCSACTSVSIMYNEDGSFLKPHFFVRPVMHTFIDTDIIVRAPSRYMWAGIGDTYAKYYEATISSRGEQLEHYTALGVAVSTMCRDPLLAYGPRALADHRQGLCSHDVEQVVLSIVVTTGIASIFLTKDFTPDYNSGLAHAVFYAMTAYPVIEQRHLHGEVVGFGVLLALLVDHQEEEFEKIYQLNRAVGLPVSLEQIEITDAQWQECMERIPAMSDIAHYPYRVTKEMLADAMQRLRRRVEQDAPPPGHDPAAGQGKIFRWSGGFCGYVRPGASGQGYFQELTEAIKKVVSLPVILTGGITEPGAAEALLQNGKADLIGVGRAILKGSSWAREAILASQQA